MVYKSYQSLLVKTWNFLAFKKPKIVTIEEIWDTQRKNVGIDISHLEFLTDPLQILIDFLNKNENFHSFGHYYIKTLFSHLLKQRFFLEKYWQQHPKVLQGKIIKPLIITGLPRTGTSFLFNCLALDTSNRYLKNWETSVSQIPPNKVHLIIDDQRRFIGKYLLKFQNHIAPQLKEAHDFYLDGPEECTPLLMQSFCTSSLNLSLTDTKYFEWLKTADHMDKYIHHKKILQTLQQTHSSSRWLLKAPGHIESIYDLFKVYPDACIINTHRTPRESVTSCANLSLAFQQIYFKNIDLEFLGRETLKTLQRDMSFYLLDRKRCNQQQFIDIYYVDLIRNPLDCIRKIYDCFSLHMSETFIENLKTYINKQKNIKKRHQYSAVKFNLDPKQINDEFEEYLYQFIPKYS